MIYAVIILSLLLAGSVTVNAVAIWYIRRLVDMSVEYTENLDGVLEGLEDRLDTMKKYAGRDLVMEDPEVRHIVNTIRGAQDDLQNFRDSFTIVNVIDDDNFGDEEINE